MLVGEAARKLCGKIGPTRASSVRLSTEAMLKTFKEVIKPETSAFEGMSK